VLCAESEAAERHRVSRAGECIALDAASEIAERYQAGRGAM